MPAIWLKCSINKVEAFDKAAPTSIEPLDQISRVNLS